MGYNKELDAKHKEILNDIKKKSCGCFQGKQFNKQGNVYGFCNAA